MSVAGEPMGQGWLQIGELGLAFVLSALIGLEREIRQKSLGLRTYTLVGFASALILIVSKYGFTDILATGQIVLDPSRIAAQIVSGVGFIGGGVIFVRRDAVRGLTTAATLWLTTAVGMACGAGLPVLAVAVTAGHFVVMLVFPPLLRCLPRSRWSPSIVRVSYLDGHGILRDVLVACTVDRFTVSRVKVERAARTSVGADLEATVDSLRDADAASARTDGDGAVRQVVTVVLEVRGTRPVAQLAARLGDLSGVVTVSAGDADAAFD